MTDTPKPSVPAAAPDITLGQDPVAPDPTTDAAAAAAPTTTGLTDEDKNAVRSAAILAGALVSRAESGFIDTFRESFAASKAIKAAPPEIQQLLVGMGLPSIPKAGSPAELESATLDLLRQAASILTAKAPQLVEGYRATVLQSCRDVAAAADDTSANETSAITKVEQALAG